jgi:hypothetical protein
MYVAQTGDVSSSCTAKIGGISEFQYERTISQWCSFLAMTQVLEMSLPRDRLTGV